MSGSSDVPSTRLWLERICSSSVEPARGMPTMKIGSGDSQPPGRSAKASRREGSDAPIDQLVDVLGAIGLELEPQRVARE